MVNQIILSGQSLVDSLLIIVSSWESIMEGSRESGELENTTMLGLAK